MMEELAKILPTWQLDKAGDGQGECLFTVLYSDIGKVRLPRGMQVEKRHRGTCSK
jgi:hypothetical protein